jgi:hypothetical protein
MNRGTRKRGRNNVKDKIMKMKDNRKFLAKKEKCNQRGIKKGKKKF